MDNEAQKHESSGLTSELQLLSASTLSDAVERGIKNATASLSSALDQAESWIRADFNHGIDMLESNRDWLATQVGEHIAPKLAELLSPVQSSVEAKNSNEGIGEILSLVSKDDFEGWLAVDMAVKFLERELSSELLVVCQILSDLSGSDVDTSNCPIGPNECLTGVKYAVDKLEIKPATQTIIYKALSKSLFDDLSDFYGAILSLAERAGLDTQLRSETTAKKELGSHEDDNQTLLDDGLLESLDDIKGEQQRYQHGQAYAGAGGVSANSNGLTGATSDVSQIGTLNALTRLQTSVNSGGVGGNDSDKATSAAPPIVNPEAYFATAEVLNVLSQLQIQQENHTLDKNHSMRQSVELALSRGRDGGRSISSGESELIDVTDKFFEVILSKIGAEGLLKSWIEKLKFTILKVVLQDESFFSDIHHPARQLLNKLAKLAAGKSRNPRMEQILDRYVDQVVQDYDGDSGAIEAVLEEINKLLDRQEKAFVRNSERLARTYEGKQKIAQARSLVVKDVNEHIGGKKVPLVLMELLDKAGWRDQMVVSLLRGGRSGDSYHSSLLVVEQLMHWLGTESLKDEQWAIELEIELEAPSMVEMINRELAASGKTDFEAIIKRLNDCFFNGVKPTFLEVEEYEWPFESDENELEELKPYDVTQNELGHWHKRAVSMKIGDWLEIGLDGGQKRTLRLAWAGSESFRFVFVDGAGMKDVDLSIDDLVEKLKNGDAAFVQPDDVPLVDQGLHQMVQGVYEELSSQASCDSLTGLLNRQAFERQIEREIASLSDENTSCALFYIDIDQFRLTNSNYGHLAGDAILKHTANILRIGEDEGIFVSRIGGNEFGVLAPRLGVEDARARCEKYRVAFEKAPMQWEGQEITNTVSVGLAFVNFETDSCDSIMRKASLACAAAKDQGHNRVVEFQKQEEDLKRRDEMLRWIQELDKSLDDLLTLRCQEIRPNDHSGDAKSHYEVLLGVRQEGGIIPPGALIQAAEHFGRMARIDRWVIHHVLQWMEENSTFVDNTGGFSVNVSGNSLNDDTFLDFVLGELAASSIEKHKLCFEITETAAITNLANAIEFVRVLKQTGCKFSLDDFGSGLSSYAYIQKLPVDYIKIDGIFVRNLVNEQRDQALVRSINEMAHFMGMKTVAEFVENDDILEKLREIGVDHSQGFGIKKPMLLNDLASSL